MRGKTCDDFMTFTNYICFKKFKVNKQFFIVDRFKILVYNNVLHKKNFCGCHDEFQ